MIVLTRSLTLFLWLFFLTACTGAIAAERTPATPGSIAPEASDEVEALADAPAKSSTPAAPDATTGSITTAPESTSEQADETASAACPLTEPIWVKPPDDSAVLTPPEFDHYFVNADRSIWASAWFTEEYPLRAGEDGNKMGWFRPAGATLEITGRRIDAEAPPLEAHIPCCYPTRFQATGLVFPTEGCWEVTAKADESELTFVVQVK
jgi:hypothetical protein